MKKKILLSLLPFLFIGNITWSQEWMQLIADPSSNYFTAEHAFRQWQDSIEQRSRKKGILNFFNKGKIEEQNEIREEAEERFMHWANERKMNSDENGNPLSTDAIWTRFKNERFQNNRNLFTNSQGNWYSRGPGKITATYGEGKGIGRMACMVIDPNDSNIIYAGAPFGGLWKSIDEGANWIPILDSLAALAFVEIAIDPLNGNNLYAIIGWKFFKSTDAGASWTVTPTPDLSTSKINIRLDKSNTQIIYVSSSYHGLLKSTDGGNSFTLISTRNFYDIEIKPGNSNTIYGLLGTWLMRSVDGGNTFDTASVIPTGAAKRIAVTPADSQYVYACGGTGNGFGGRTAVSTDGGDTFTALPATNNIDSFNSFDCFDVSETDKNHLIHGGTILSASYDGGQTWNFVSKYYINSAYTQPYVHPDDMDVMFHGNSVWVCTDGGIVKSEDGGLSWIDKSNGLSVSRLDDFDCSETDSSFFIAGAWDNSILLHTDSGWAGFGGGDGYDVAINPLNKYNFYGKNQNGFYRSMNGINNTPTWPFRNITESYYAYRAGFPVRFNHQNEHSVYISVNHVWKSIDDGDSVRMLPMQGGAYLFISPVDSNIIFSQNDRSVDDGATVTRMSYYIRAIDPDEAGKVWASSFGNPYKIYFSSDTGSTWTAIPSFDLAFSPGTGNILLSCANNSHNGIFLCYKSVVYYYDDRLSNWQPFTKGLPYVTITKLMAMPAVGKIRLSTHGRGIWESNMIFDSTQALEADFVSDKVSICHTNSITFYDNSLNNGPGYHPTYHWNFPGGIPSSSSSASQVVYYNLPGTYDVSLSIVNDNGSDSIIKISVITVSNSPVYNLPFTEGFESGAFPLTGWNWNIFRPVVVWSQNNNYGGYGLTTKSINYWLGGNNTAMTDFMTTPEMNFQSPNPALSFDYLYATDTLPNDTLKIFYTNDCGLTRHYIYERGGIDLITDTMNLSVIYHPPADAWRTDTIFLDSLAGQTVELGFEVVSHELCAILLDNINMFNLFPNNVNQIVGEELKYFPNPVHDKLNIDLKDWKNIPVTFSLYNLLGEKLAVKNGMGNSMMDVDLSEIEEGIYFVVVQGGDRRLTGKIILIK